MPIVATNEAYFASPDDYEAHDALLCIAEGRYVTEDNRRRLSREHFFKTAEQMAKLFADLPEALANTIEIARRCAFRPAGRKPILPRFVAAAPGTSEVEQLKLETVGTYSLVYAWPGTDANAAPILLMAHQDVVPVSPGTDKQWHAAPLFKTRKDSTSSGGNESQHNLCSTKT